MPSSQNALFVGESPADPEYDHPPGAAIARMIECSFRDRGYSTNAVDNWRDCGWSFDCAINNCQFEICLAQTSEPKLWMLQNASTNEPGCIAWLFGKRSADFSDAIHKIACEVHETLQINGHTSLRWCIDGYPDYIKSTPVPTLAPRKAT